MASNNKKIWSNLPYSKKIFTLQHKAVICIIISHKLVLIQGILNIYTWQYLNLHFFKKKYIICWYQNFHNLHSILVRLINEMLSLNQLEKMLKYTHLLLQ